MLELGCEAYAIKHMMIPPDEDDSEKNPQAMCALMIHGEVFTWTVSPSVKTARVKACEMALRKLKDISIPRFRSICDCEDIRKRMKLLKGEEKT